MKNVHQVCCAALLGLSVATCATQEEPLLFEAKPTEAHVTGRVFKGLVRSTTVTAYEVLENGEKGRELASHLTDNAGEGDDKNAQPGTYRLTISGYEGPVLLEATGEDSRFIDEASETEVRFSRTDVLSVVIPMLKLGDTRTVTISPFTEFARRLAFCPDNRSLPLQEAHEKAKQAVAETFHVPDFIGLEPADLHGQAPTGRSDKTYAIALAALSQSALMRSGAGSVMSLVNSLANDFDDCKADGRQNGTPIRVGATDLGEIYYRNELATAALIYAARNPNLAPEAYAFADKLNPDPIILRGRVDLQPIARSAVTAYALGDDGSTGALLGRSFTGQDGEFTLVLSAYQGPILLSTSAGTYFEAATGKMVTLGKAEGLHAVLPSVGFGQVYNSIVISPLTEWAYRSLQCAAGNSLAERWNSATDIVANTFGIPEFQTTLPADLPAGPVTGATASALRHGLLNAGLSELAHRWGTTSYGIVQHIAIDFEDCGLDGLQHGVILHLNGLQYHEATFRKGLVDAVVAFIEGPRNLSGLTAIDISEALSVFGGAIHGTIGGQVYKGVADQYEIVATDWHNWISHGEISRGEAENEKFSLDIFDFYGPLKLTAEGATAVYRDEELQASVPFGSNTLSALIPSFRNGDNLSYTISPLSDFAFTLAACYVQNDFAPANDALNQANVLIGAHFGVGDFYGTIPKNLTRAGYAGVVTDADRFAMALAGLSRLAQDINQKSGLPSAAHISSIELVTKLSSDLANDCMWDGVGPGNQPLQLGAYNFSANTMRIELAEATSAWMQSEKNKSGIPLREFNAYARFLSENGSSLFPGGSAIHFDITAPVLSFTPVAGTWVQGSTSVTIVAADKSAIALLAITSPAGATGLSDLSVEPSTLTVTLPTEDFPDGPLDLFVEAADVNGNHTVVKYKLQIDNQPPRLSIPGFTTNQPLTGIHGSWDAPSGITWASLKNLSNGAFSPVSILPGFLNAEVTLPHDGEHVFLWEARNRVGNSVTYSTTVTRDTQGPTIYLEDGVHHGPSGPQSYSDSVLVTGDFTFAVMYPTHTKPLEYPDTLFSFRVTDVSGVHSYSKRLFRNGALVSAPDPELPHLGLSTLGNNLHKSIALAPTPTLWEIEVIAVDKLGNVSSRRYPFTIKVDAALTRTSYIRGDMCSSTTGTGRYLRDYDGDCPTAKRDSNGRLRVDELENGGVSAWVNNRVSIAQYSFRNDTDIEIQFNPTAFSADYNQKFTINELKNERDLWSGLQDEYDDWPGGCSVWPNHDLKYDSSGKFEKCFNKDPSHIQTGRGSSYQGAYEVTPLLTITNENNTVLSGNAGWYSVAPGVTVRVYLQIPSLSGGLITKSLLCKDEGLQPDYWGYRLYTWRYYLTGVTKRIYWRYNTCIVTEKLKVTYLSAGFSGGSYRYRTRTPFDQSHTPEISSGATLPFFNNVHLNQVAK